MGQFMQDFIRDTQGDMAHTIQERVFKEWNRYLSQVQLENPPPLNLYLTEGEERGVKSGGEGYCIDTGKNKLAIYAARPEGLLYGVFTLIRLCRIAGNIIPEIKLVENPAFQTRLLWSWSRLIKGYRHAPYLNFRSVINPNSMMNPEQYPEMMRFIRNMAQMGVNALAITHELH
ncbi:MAG: hypothetical protein FWF26_03115, partial [Treponema sp.]|nr:hypothetical protein [Treponema sp.]